VFRATSSLTAHYAGVNVPNRKSIDTTHPLSFRITNSVFQAPGYSIKHWNVIKDFCVSACCCKRAVWLDASLAQFSADIQLLTAVRGIKAAFRSITTPSHG